MNVYEWMRVITQKVPLSEPLQRDALDLVDSLEARSVFGTMAGATEVTEHEPQYPPMSSVCSICQKEHES